MKTFPRIELSIIVCLCTAGCAAGSGAVGRTPSSPVTTAIATPCPAQPPAQVALDRLFRSSAVDSEWFAASFLQAVPVDKIRDVLATIRTNLGGYRSVSGSGDSYVATFERGTVAAHALVDGDGRFTGLVLEPPRSDEPSPGGT